MSAAKSTRWITKPTFASRWQSARKRGWSRSPNASLGYVVWDLAPPSRSECATYASDWNDPLIKENDEYYHVPRYFWRDTCVEDLPEIPEDQVSANEARDLALWAEMK